MPTRAASWLVHGNQSASQPLRCRHPIAPGIRQRGRGTYETNTHILGPHGLRRNRPRTTEGNLC